MKISKLITFIFLALFPLHLTFAQGSAPASTSASSIPVISIGDKIKPMEPSKKEKEKVKDEVKTSDNKKPTRKANARPSFEEPKAITIETRQLVHSKGLSVGDEIIFSVSENVPTGSFNIPKNTPVIGKVVEVEKISKDKAGRIKINLESFYSSPGAMIPFGGTLEITKEKDSINKKDFFLAVGSKHKVTPPKKFAVRLPINVAKSKAAKGTINAKGEMEGEKIVIQASALKYPSKITIYIEAPTGVAAEDIKEDSLKLIRINDFVLPSPISPSSDKIKIADHNKNTIKELKFVMRGKDLIPYLPEGSVNLAFLALTKEGKPIEAITTVSVEYK